VKCNFVEVISIDANDRRRLHRTPTAFRHGAPQGWREERAPTLGQQAHSAVNPEGVPPNQAVNEGATPFGVGDDLEQATQGSA
jgi:hypothetical protein